MLDEPSQPHTGGRSFVPAQQQQQYGPRRELSVETFRESRLSAQFFFFFGLLLLLFFRGRSWLAQTSLGRQIATVLVVVFVLLFLLVWLPGFFPQLRKELGNHHLRCFFFSGRKQKQQ